MRRPHVLSVAAVEYTARVLLAPQMRELEQRGYAMQLACAPDATRFGSDLDEFNPVELRFPRSPKPIPMFKALARLRQLAQELRPDIIHLHTPAAALPSRLLTRRLFPEGTRLIYTVHGFAHVWDSLTLRNLALERAERLLAGRTDALLFQSREDLAEVRKRGYPTATVYLGNGVQDRWFTGPARPSTAVRNRALFVGRLVREKGILDLLDAVALTPQLHLSIAGSQLPTERDGVGGEVSRRVATPELAGRVDLLGMIDSVALQEVVAQSDFLVLPSYREGVPRSIIEGMASGRPAVVSDVRGCRELVAHGNNGFIFQPGDIPALARSLATMIELSDAEYLAMSAAAFELVDTTYRESLVIDRLVETYTMLGFPPEAST